jgi:hypothetical protein
MDNKFWYLLKEPMYEPNLPRFRDRLSRVLGKRLGWVQNIGRLSRYISLLCDARNKNIAELCEYFLKKHNVKKSKF